MSDEANRDACAGHRNQQRSELVERFNRWITAVYELAPNNQDGDSMTFEVTAGRNGHHPRHDYALFDFRVKTTEDREVF
jgi:hypothetical protein